jgi:hypothetical protein
MCKTWQNHNIYTRNKGAKLNAVDTSFNFHYLWNLHSYTRWCVPSCLTNTSILRPAHGLVGVIMVCCTKTRSANFFWEICNYVNAVVYGIPFAQNWSLDIPTFTQCLGRWCCSSFLQKQTVHVYWRVFKFSSVWPIFLPHIYFQSHIVNTDRLCGQSSWLQIQRSRVRFLALPDLSE